LVEVEGDVDAGEKAVNDVAGAAPMGAVAVVVVVVVVVSGVNGTNAVVFTAAFVFSVGCALVLPVALPYASFGYRRGGML
jgi:hypothetical protein